MAVAKRYFTRNELAEELRQRGYLIGNSTLAKLCSPTIDKGPPLAARDGRRHLYRLQPAIRWAEARLCKPGTSGDADNTDESNPDQTA